MPQKIHIEPPSAHIPPCLFPVTGTTTCKANAAGRESITSTLGRRWYDVESGFLDQGITLPSIVKAAWAITLQSYVSSEVTSFECYGHDSISNDVYSSALSDRSMLCLFRLNETENVLDLMKRLGKGPLVSYLYLPKNYDILYVSPAPLSRFCNTAIVFEDQATGEFYPNENTLVLSVALAKTRISPISTTISYLPSSVTKDLACSVLGTLNHILSDILTSPTMAVGDVETCSYDDRQIIRQLTSYISPEARVCVHDLILKQCKLNPRRVAVCGWDGELTYGELDDLSSRLAHHLITIGVGPESFVFSCFPKSIWAVVARLAILRAGGAYISIHATNPPAYLDSVIGRTKARVMLIDPSYANQFRARMDTIVEVNSVFISTLPQKLGPACTSVGPENACLVLFTSGSTGEPKGIVQTHQAYSTAILDYIRNFMLGPHTRFFHFDEYAFDISNLELFVPLVAGGCCCVPSPVKTIRDIVDNINILQANITFLTPTVAIRMNPADMPNLQVVCMGGESLSQDLIDKWAGSKIKLVNQYGMGEVAICCAFNNNVTSQTRDIVGRPTSGPIWVVHASNPDILMPVGAVGELLIEGHHLSRQYLDQITRPTKAVFLKKAPVWMEQMHPDRITSRLYRSGDLGRLHHDGTIQYLGRQDTILKLNGCRVEALEVEQQARKCLKSNDAIVVDLLGAIDGITDPILVAYLYLEDHPNSAPASETNGEPTLSDASVDGFAAAKVEDIKHCIAQVLPAYMVPKCFLLTTWIPRTASKKTDRKKIHMVGDKYHLRQRLEQQKDPSNTARDSDILLVF